MNVIPLYRVPIIDIGIDDGWNRRACNVISLFAWLKLFLVSKYFFPRFRFTVRWQQLKDFLTLFRCIKYFLEKSNKFWPHLGRQIRNNKYALHAFIDRLRRPQRFWFYYYFTFLYLISIYPEKNRFLRPKQTKQMKLDNA